MDDFDYKPNMNVVRNARAFIRSLCDAYGTEQGMAVWDHIRKGLGDQIAGDIFLGMLTGTDQIRVMSIGKEMINAIKEVRWLTGWGLKEAKDFVDAVRDRGPQIIDVADMDQAKVEQFCRNIQKFGCTVE